jgi:hypothetical protein
VCAPLARALLIAPGMKGVTRGSWLGAAIALGLWGCANAHHIQISDIDSTRGRLEPFELRLNATGVSVSDGAAVGKALSDSRATRQKIDELETIIALTQMGPKTGDPTFSDDWADEAAHKLLARCPSGRITGLTTLRETMDYPVISGEIVTIKGYCIL